MTEKEVYEFYNNTVKIIYCEIEARNNILPVELLFEIHSAFDHLKRIHVDNEDERAAAEKAFSHLKRGVLDAFKLKLKYFNDDYNRLLKSKSDLRIIDSGKFLAGFLEDHKSIVATARQARIEESFRNIDNAFNNWYRTSILINEFEEKYFDSSKISWAKKQSFFRFYVSF